MGKKARTNDAVSILHQRYVKDDPGRKELLDHERSNAEIARLVYDLRTQALAKKARRSQKKWDATH